MGKKIKKLLTLEDLIEFCKNTNFSKFDSSESGYRLAIHVPAYFEKEEDIDENHVGMLKLKIKMFHTGVNRNGSYVSEEEARKAMSTIGNRPVLAYIHQLKDKSWDFEGHNIIVETGEDGDERLVYLEQQVGSFSAEEATFEYDEKLDKNFVCAYAYIPEEYTRACDIIREKGGTKNSVELNVGELIYNAKEKYLELKSFYVSGSTLLGKDEDGNEIQEGMLGSRADIVDFSVDNNSVINNSRYVTDFNIDSVAEKGGDKQMGMIEIFEEDNIDVTNEETSGEDVTDTEITEEIDEMTDTEVANDDSAEDIDKNTEGINEDDTESAEADTTKEIKESKDGADSINVENENNNTSIEYSVQLNGKVKSFSLSLNDIQYALNNLINETYSEQDSVWYYTDVYVDESYVVMRDYWGMGQAYKQSFKRENNNFALIGDRVEVHNVWLTDDEETELNNIRSDFSAVSEKLKKYETEEQNAEKVKILESEEYEMIHNESAYKELVKDYAKFSVDEVKAKCDSILLDYVKVNQKSVRDEIDKKKKEFHVTPLPSTQKKKSRYGNLFSSK